MIATIWLVRGCRDVRIMELYTFVVVFNLKVQVVSLRVARRLGHACSGAISSLSLPQHMPTVTAVAQGDGHAHVIRRPTTYDDVIMIMIMDDT